jgi:hypothetical protein
MEIFNKRKKPSMMKKKSVRKDKNKLSKYLPSTLFIGVQEDINEKALVSYITSLAQSAFANPKEAKYSIKKMGKNKFIYEMHNGSQDLTYLPLVIDQMIEGGETELILKTNGQNVRVLRRTSVKLESNVLIASNNRDEDAIVDYDTKGNLKYIIKQGSEIFIISSLSAIITGFIAGASFVSKYYMLNEDYSYDPEVRKAQTAVDFLRTISPEEHTKYRYLESINYINYTWVKKFTEITPPPEPVVEKEEMPEEVIVEETAVNVEVDPLTIETAKELEVAAEEYAAYPNEVVAENVVTGEDVKGIDLSVEMASLEKEYNMENLANKNEKSVGEEKLEVSTVVEKEEIKAKVKVVAEVKEDDFEIPSEDKNIDGYVSVKEEDVKNLDATDLPQNVVVVEEGEGGFFGNDFEILNEENIESLDLSNLPENIILE